MGLHLIAKEDLKAGLPALFSQKDEPDPMIYKKLVGSQKGWTCYLAEASERGSDLLLFGYFNGQEPMWSSVSLSRLKAEAKKAGLAIRVDVDFQPMRFSRIGSRARRPTK